MYVALNIFEWPYDDELRVEDGTQMYDKNVN